MSKVLWEVRVRENDVAIGAIGAIDEELKLYGNFSSLTEKINRAEEIRDTLNGGKPPPLQNVRRVMDDTIRPRPCDFEYLKRLIVEELMLFDGRNYIASEWEHIAPDVKFTDIGLDSLDTVEIIMIVEDAYGVNISDEQADDIYTTQDLVNLVQTLRA